MKYRFTLTQTNRWEIEIEADSQEEAESRFWDNGSLEYYDPLWPDETDADLFPLNDGERLPAVNASVPDLSADDLRLIADSLLSEMKRFREITDDLLFESELNEQTSARVNKLKDLYTRITERIY